MIMRKGKEAYKDPVPVVEVEGRHFSTHRVVGVGLRSIFYDRSMIMVETKLIFIG